MRLDERTKVVLANFAQFNNRILLREGDVITTMTEGMSVVARARVAEPIEREFAIHNLTKFLGVARLFKDPKVEIGEHALTLTEGDKRVLYTHADPALPDIPKTPTKEPDLKADASFHLSGAALKELKDAASVLAHKEWAIVGEKGVLYVETSDANDVSKDKYRVRVGEAKKPFRLVLPIDSLRIIAADYDVDVAFRGFIRFKTDGLVYYAAVVAKKSVTT